MILDSKLTFISHIKEAIVKARRGIGIIRFLSKYVTCDVLDQIYKLHVRPHLDYGDIMYHKYDPEFKLDFEKLLECTQYSAALAVSGACRGTNTDFKNFTGKSFIIGYGIDVYVTFINCKATKDRHTYITKYHMNVLSVTFYEHKPNVFQSSAKSTDRLTHTYFQNCVREWNQTDQSIRNYPTISGFKSQLVRLVRPTKNLFSVFMTLKE